MVFFWRTLKLIKCGVVVRIVRQGLEKMEREKQKTAEKIQPKESLDFNHRRGDEKYEKLSPQQFSKFVSFEDLFFIIF